MGGKKEKDPDEKITSKMLRDAKKCKDLAADDERRLGVGIGK